MAIEQRKRSSAVKRTRRRASVLEPDPLWYKDAVIYEAHVRAFYDSNGDGVGDFAGLREKLPYLQDLGVTAIWLLPFYPSPLRDDGYDIQDYCDVHPSYGTLRDFRLFLREAHARGIRVIIELVLNHTSDQHPWFQRARRAKPGSKWRNFYVWSDRPDRYKEARIIFKDFETSNWAWDPVAKAYYWHRFYSHQPDLNYDNPAVRRAIFSVLDFWLGLGVDGLRLDAVPYLFEREGTNCENLPETHAFLRQLREYVDSRYPNRMLLAEANQWPEDAVAYFGEGDECHMAFHFPLMPRLFMAMHMEDRFPIVDILRQTPEIPPTCQWALFLRNHDELTLEMVTDEERDYMYRVYAADARARINLGIRRRLAPLLGNNRRKIELMNGLLMSLPGTPVVYYGDEIGMGDNIYLGDRNSVRTPMQWSADRNAGFSRANPQRLYLPVIIDPEYHYEAVNVEAQQNNPHSLLWWMKRLIALRRRHRAFGRGSLQMLYPENPRVLAFVRQYQDETILVVANLARFCEYVELDLSRYRGWTPEELFGGKEFPTIGELPYLLTIGPHSFYWFRLRPPAPAEISEPEPSEELPAILTSSLDQLWDAEEEELTDALARWIVRRPWFLDKHRSIKGLELVDRLLIEREPETWFLLTRVEFASGDPSLYTLPVTLHEQGAGDGQPVESSDEAIAVVRVVDGPSFVLAESTATNAARRLLELFQRGRKLLPTSGGAECRVLRVRGVTSLDLAGSGLQPMGPARGHHSHTLLHVNHRAVLKVFRKVEEGTNPEWELGAYLTRRGFPHSVRLYGAFEWVLREREPITVAVLQEFVPNEGTAWEHTLHALGAFFEQAVAYSERRREAHPLVTDLATAVRTEPPEEAKELIGGYLEHARTIGRRLGQLQCWLASNRNDPSFAPEPTAPFNQRSIYQSIRNACSQTTLRLRQQLRQGRLTGTSRQYAREIVEREERVQGHIRELLSVRLRAARIRCHGNLSLHELLYTGNDFIFVDFEGNPLSRLGERRLKRPALRDLASLLHSFLHAAQVGLQAQESRGLVSPEQRGILEEWCRFWFTWVGANVVAGYLDEVRGREFVPREEKEWRVFLEAFLLEKAFRELQDDLEYRPAWVAVSLRVARDIVRAVLRADGE